MTVSPWATPAASPILYVRLFQAVTLKIKRMLDWPKRYKLAHAFLCENSYKRLKRWPNFWANLTFLSHLESLEGPSTQTISEVALMRVATGNVEVMPH